MDNAQLITDVKELLGNAETEKALNRLAEFLGSDPKYKQLNRLVLQARAQFQKAQRDELQGLVSGEQSKLNYNQVTRQALQIVEWLEEGNLRPETSFPPPPPRRWPMALGAVILLMVLAGGGYWWFQRQEPDLETTQTADCPIDEAFPESSEFNILLRPFQTVAGEEQKPHLIIAKKLDDFIKGLKIDCDFGTLTDVDPDSFFTDADADTAAIRCGANLIIWGTVEKPAPSDSSTIQMNYKFVSQDSFVKLSKLELTGGSELVKVNTLSNIPTGTTLTQSIFESIKLLFGLIAHETGDRSTAIEMLEGYEPAPEDTTAHLLKGMVLAEDYMANNQDEKAWESYNQLLEVHPEYPLARNNRGILNYQKGNYEDAAEDFSVFLKKDSTNAEVLEIRGSAYLKADQLKKARLDLQKVKELRVPDRELNRKIEEVDKKIEEEEKTKASAEAEIRANPNNLAAWNQKAISSQKLGDYKEAARASEVILRQDPDNVNAYLQIIKAYRSAGDTILAEKAIQRAEAAGISRSRLNQMAPLDITLSPRRTNTIIPLKKN